jgi:hypothetical protein
VFDRDCDGIEFQSCNQIFQRTRGSGYNLCFGDNSIPEIDMTRALGLVLPALVALAAGSSALADPPVAATIPEPQPVTATIPEPAARPVATTVSQATVNGVAPITNYGAEADTRMICKTETPVGSRLGGHRVCMTKADWDKQSQDAIRQRNFAPSAGISGSH